MAGIAALAFVALAVLVARQGPFAIDAAITTAVQGLPIPVAAWEAMTALGGIILIPIAVATILAALMTGRDHLRPHHRGRPHRIDPVHGPREGRHRTAAADR